MPQDVRIIRLDEPGLRVPATSVRDPGSDAIDLAAVAAGLTTALTRYQRSGMAAPVIGTAVRMIALDVDGMCQVRRLSGVASGAVVHFDPEITPLAGEMAEDYETCVSIPRTTGLVARPSRIRYRATTSSGEPVDWELFGRAARVVAHQVDHLDGVLFLDHADPSSVASMPRLSRDDSGR
ncbi:peptide deformylase [Nocardia abscessus]|uniref:peptide deformylase n=1 Tax=Nocardia abscessus TaxID=120957 RepID=UPI001894F008|nr:peptide deformylase [Nocardia abscessus]MBF6337187.1 peptide deformylase [Nocardia abscessus]